MTLEELQAANFHWRLAIDQVDDGVLILTGGIENLAALKVRFANSSVATRLGVTPGQLEGVSFAQLLRLEDRERFRSEWLASDPQAIFHGNFPLRGADSRTVNATWSISSRAGTSDQEPDHTVTLHWKPEAEAADEGTGSSTGESAFELNKADTIAHIAQGIVHDFNNSLTTICGHLEVVLPEAREGTPVHAALSQAMQAAVTTSQLCRRLLNYSKGRRSAKRPCQVSELLQQAEAITGLGSNVVCKRVVPPDVWPILADSIEIVQVINNLLVNAHQAMPHGGTIALVAENVPVKPDSTLSLPPGRYVALTVRDRGIGIPKDQQERIFEKLYTTKADGTGLGLATCAQIVSAHDGFIDVHSVPNRGTEFIVYLPASSKALPAEAPLPVPPSPQRASPTQLRILVVEDQVGISTITKTYLEKNGHEVTCVMDGKSAMSTFHKAWQTGDPFDLAIVDMTLPGGMNGEDTFRELRRIDPHMVGIATSGSMDEDSLAIYQEKGFATILPKPFPLKALTDVVAEAMHFHLMESHSP